jgi:TP901 family phage tail tape measure protein
MAVSKSNFGTLELLVTLNTNKLFTDAEAAGAKAGQKLSSVFNREFGKGIDQGSSQAFKLLMQRITAAQNQLNILGKSVKISLDSSDINTAKEQAKDLRSVLSNPFKVNINTAGAKAGFDEIKRHGGLVHDALTVMYYGFLGSLGVSIRRSISNSFGGAGAFLGDSLKEFSEYEKQLNTFKMVSSATAEEVAKLKVAVAGVGDKISPKEAGVAAVELAKFGFSAKETAEQLKGVIDLNISTGLNNIEKAAYLAGTAYTSFGMSAAQAANLIGATANQTAINPYDFSQAFSKAGSIFKQNGQDAATLATAFGLLRNSGFEASTAATALKTGLLRLTAPMKQGRDALQTLGVSAYDSNGKMKNTLALVLEMKDKLASFAPRDQNRMVKAIFGDRGAPAFLALMQQTQQKISEVYNAASNADADGYADKNSKKMLAGLPGAETLFAASFGTLKTNIGNTFAPIKEALLRTLNDVFNKINAGDLFKNLFKSFDDFKKLLLGSPQIAEQLASALGRIVELMSSSLVESARQFTEYLSMNPDAIGNMANKIVEVATALGNATQKAVAFSVEFGKGFLAGMKDISNVSKPLADFIIKLTGADNPSKSLAQNLGKIASYAVAFSIISGAFTALIGVVATVTSLAATFGSIAGFIKTIGVGIAVLNPITVTILGVVAAVAITLTNIYTYTTYWSDVCLGVKQTWDDLVDVIGDFVSDIVKGIGDSRLFQTIWDSVKASIIAIPFAGVVNSIGSAVSQSNLFKGAWEGLGNTFKAIGDWIKQYVIDPIMAAKEAMGGLTNNPLANAAGNVAGAVMNPLGALGDMAVGGFNAAKNAVFGGGQQESDAGARVAEMALSQAGKQFAPGMIEQCANFVRFVLEQAKVKVGVTNKALDGLDTGKALASSFFGEDIGEIIRDKKQIKKGDLLAFGGTYGGYGKNTVTHVGVAVGGGQMVDRSTKSAPVRKRSIDTFEGPNSGFLYAVRPHAYGSQQQQKRGITSENYEKLPKGKITSEVYSKQQTSQQMTAAQLIIKEANKQGITDAKQIAYMLATAQHESMFKPIREFSSGRQYEGRSDLGNTQAGDGVKYKGRGYVQLTGRANYEKYSKLTGKDLVNNPDAALEPQTAAQILVHGMKTGNFTGRKIGDYVGGGKADYRNARRTINGMDRADLIAGYAKEWEQKLKKDPMPAGGPKVNVKGGLIQASTTSKAQLAADMRVDPEKQKKEEDKAEKERLDRIRKAVESDRKWMDSNISQNRDSAKQKRQQQRETEVTAIDQKLAGITDPNVKRQLEYSKKELTEGSQFDERITDLREKRGDLNTAKLRKSQDLKSKDPDRVDAAKQLPDYTRAISDIDALIAGQIKLKAAAMGVSQTEKEMADTMAKTNQERASRDQQAEQSYQKQVQALEVQKSQIETEISKLGDKDFEGKAKLESQLRDIEVSKQKLQIQYEQNKALGQEQDKLKDLTEQRDKYLEVLKAGGKKTDPTLEGMNEQIKLLESGIDSIKAKSGANLQIISNQEVQNAEQLKDALKAAADEEKRLEEEKAAQKYAKDSYIEGTQLGTKKALGESLLKGNAGQSKEGKKILEEVAVQELQIKHKERLLELEKQIKAVEGTENAFSPEEIAGIKSSLEQLNSIELSGLRDEFNETKSVMTELGNSIQQSLTSNLHDFLMGTKTAGEAFKSFLSDMASQLLNQGIKMLFSQLFGGGGMGGMLGGLFGGGGGMLGGGGGGGLGFLGGIIGAPGFAKGNISQGYVNNYARGNGVLEAFNREKQQGSGNPMLAVINDREAVLSAEQTRRFFDLGLDKLVQGKQTPNYAMGNLPAVSASSGSTGGSGTTINVPINIANDGGSQGQKPSIDVQKLQQSIRTTVLSELQTQGRNGGMLKR